MTAAQFHRSKALTFKDSSSCRLTDKKKNNKNVQVAYLYCLFLLPDPNHQSTKVSILFTINSVLSLQVSHITGFENHVPKGSIIWGK